MTYEEEEEKIKKERLDKIIAMSDTEKLNYIVSLLQKNEKIEMFTDCSDWAGISFTDDYYAIQGQIEEFLESVKKTK